MLEKKSSPYNKQPRRKRRPRSNWSALWTCLLCILMFLSTLPLHLHAGQQKDTTLEYRIKSAFLFNFCKFISWPETSFSHPDAPLMITVLGKDPFGNALDPLKGKKVRGHALEIKYAKNIETVKNCHLLFVSKSMTEQIDKIISHTQAFPIVTVGDMENFASRGGMINFYMAENKIRF